MQTTPDGIPYPGLSDTTGIVPSLATLAESVQDALTARANYYVGDNTDMAAQEANAPEGAVFYNTDDNTEYRMESGSWSSGGSGPGTSITYFRWADATERAAQTGMVAGDRGYQLDNGITYQRIGSEWIPDPLFCSLGKASEQSIGTTETAVTWPVEHANAGGMHSGANPSRIVAPVAGTYEFNVSFYAAATSGVSTAYARLNGSTAIPGSLDRVTGTASTGTPLKLQFSVNLAANAYVEIMYSHSTSTQTIGWASNQFGPSLTAKYLGPS